MCGGLSGHGERTIAQQSVQTWVLYRVVHSDPATLRDFTSNLALGFPLRTDTVEARRLWSGISVFDSETRARRVALRYPTLGSFIAVLHVPETAAMQIERTTTTRGHYTLWGEPADLLACVIQIVSV